MVVEVAVVVGVRKVSQVGRSCRFGLDPVSSLSQSVSQVGIKLTLERTKRMWKPVSLHQ